ncbi:MAG: tRNA uracil 4-sulfurtransferase ThiI [Candidatus Borkfalkiaceae bacterium]|nr:tRNA uracil 4-sulfurtransferase ThiI [Christensenellaceae bacterium]
MNKIIIVRYCEIHLKGKNRGYFERMLFDNIRRALENLNCKPVRIPARYLIENFDEADEAEIISRLQKVGGVHSISPAILVENDKDKIYEIALSLCKGKIGTFKVETNRADKTFPIHSIDLSRDLGGEILKRYAPALSVNVKNPDFTVNIDIRESGDTLIYTDVLKGIGGMPVGSAGCGLLLLSGGIDSPVAGYMMTKRGMRLKALHFHSYPYTSDDAKQKVISLAEKLSVYSGGIDMFVVSVTHIQEAIHEKCPEELMITILRRFMMRLAQIIAEKNGAQAIITGESLGQVASQTIESITTSNAVVTLPVFRPLIAFDKLDIIDVARKIDTYETSILPFEDCCTVFLPRFPAIKPKLEKVEHFEKALDVDALISEALANIEKIKI